jgi:uncharacterized membrane-anchored protein YitT (DUF2179 family)
MELIKKLNMKVTPKELILDLLICLVSGVIVSFSYHVFSTPNDFAPGGVSGIASLLSYLTKINMGWYMIICNAPIFILVCIFVSKKTGAMLLVYMGVQAGTLLLLEYINFPTYVAPNNLIFACIGAGVISGFGFSIMLRRFGASGGTYAISSLIKHFKPETNVAYVSFLLDSSVVILAYFCYNFSFSEPFKSFDNSLATLLNLFIANVIVNIMLSGLKSGYKLEIITTNPEEITEKLLSLHLGVTEINVKGMYTMQDKYELVCIIRKRYMGVVLKVLKQYPSTFCCVTNVSEVIGKFER